MSGHHKENDAAKFDNSLEIKYFTSMLRDHRSGLTRRLCSDLTRAPPPKTINTTTQFQST